MQKLSESVNFGVRMPRKRHERLRRLAVKNGRTVNWTLNDAIEAMLKAEGVK